MADRVIKLEGRGLRGESFAEVARRVGSIGDIAIPAGATDADILNLMTAGIALTGANTYADIAAGLAATADGDSFWVADASGLALYRNDGGSAVEIDPFTAASKISVTGGGTVQSALDDLDAAVGTLAGDSQALADIADDLRLGTAVQIDVFSDSTGRGVIGQVNGSTSTISASPWPSVLAGVLNAYFGNSALTVNNFSEDNGTAGALLAGTGVFTVPFTDILDASSARAAFICFGINDAVGVYSASAATFIANLKTMILECRRRDIVPVLFTPFPSLSVGFHGSLQYAEEVKYFIDVVRIVARQTGAFLVDFAELTHKMLQNNRYSVRFLIPDGIHPVDTLYSRAGYTAARAFIAQLVPFTNGDQFQILGTGNVQAAGMVSTSTVAARLGSIVSTSGAGSKTMRILFDVEEPGLDIYLANHMQSNGSNTFNLVLDGATATTLSMNSAGYTSGAVGAIRDFETCFAENIDPGVHLVSMTCSDPALDLAANHLRARRTTRYTELKPSLNATSVRRVLLAPELAITATAANGNVLFDRLPSNRALHDLEVEFVANFAVVNAGLIIHGYRHSVSSSAGVPRWGVLYHLTTGGLLAISESTSPSAATVNTQGAVDLRGVSRKYRVRITTAGVATTWVDDVQIGGTVNLAEAYKGGLFGLWLNTTGTQSISNLYQIFR